MKRVGIIYHPKIAKNLAEEISQLLLSLKASFWLCSAWEEEKIKGQVPGTDLALSIGGDGTILRVARAIIPLGIPILGVNLGKLGFMSELKADEVRNKLPALLGGEGWIDERAMLEAETLPSKKGINAHFHALNDVMVGRGAIPRIVYVKVTINGGKLTTFKADGVIASTATGSTGYSLAIGGPILYPQSKDILLKPISAHLTMAHALVLPSQATIELEVHADYDALLSIDGQVNLPLSDGDKVKVKSSPYLTRFLRIYPPVSFYSTLEEKLRGNVEGRKGKDK